MPIQALDKKKAGLLIVDVQEKLFPHVDHPCELLPQMLKAIEGCKILGLPILVAEQNPKGLGPTIEPIRQLLEDNQTYFPKTAFSCLNCEALKSQLKTFPVSQWVVLGLEAHVCVLQTVRDLIGDGLQAIVLNDAISSRSIYDFSTAIAEMRDFGARITSTETMLFELLKDAKEPEFKQIIHLLK